MSMRIRLKSGNGWEFAIAKLLRMTAAWILLWKDTDVFVRMRITLPPIVKPIEANTIACTHASLTTNGVLPPSSFSFESRTRLISRTSIRPTTVRQSLQEGSSIGGSPSVRLRGPRRGQDQAQDYELVCEAQKRHPAHNACHQLWWHVVFAQKLCEKDPPK